MLILLNVRKTTALKVSQIPETIKISKTEPCEISFLIRYLLRDEVHNIGSDDIQNEKPSSHYIERVLTHSKNNKLILLSATPMFDSSTEIISILNMLLMNDDRPTIPRDKAIKGDITDGVRNSYQNTVKGMFLI